MISKRIDRKGKTSSFERLGHYVLEAKTQGAAILWTRTAEYVVDLKGYGEKVLWSRLSNCEAEIPILAIAEIEATQAQNTRSKTDKTYHLVISFPEGEIPTREQLEDIEDTMCQALGFGEHQRISAVHQDTENLHLHVAINKIHPVTFHSLDPYFDYNTRDRVCRELEQKHNLLVDKGIGQAPGKGRAGALEAHTGEQSLLSWIRENLGEQLKEVQAQGQNWETLHALLAEHGLLIKPRGAGLVIALVDGSLGVKASAVDRGLSFKTLTERFGAYIPPQQVREQTKLENSGQSPPMEHSYQREPIQRHPGATSLWAQYQKEKESAFRIKANALHALKVEHEHYSLELKDWYRTRRASVKANTKLTAKSKRGLYQELSLEMKAEFAQRKQMAADQRQSVREQNPSLSWDQWLVQKAEQGNMDALGVLRGREKTRKRLAQALLTADDIEAVKHVIYPHLKPMTRKNGDVVYRLKDGGVVEDSAQAVHVPEITEAAAFLALTLANERFAGKALIVEGTTQFKIQVAELSALKGVSVRFTDEVMEKTRKRFVLARELAEKDQQNSPASEPTRAQRQQEPGRER
jgi:hypothetical protein